MQTLAILGLGLMGGSLGLAAKRGSIVSNVRAYARREESRDAALEHGAADAVFDSPQAAVADADIVVVCVPVSDITDLVSQCVPGLKQGAIITDVGSTKREVCAAGAESLKGLDSEFVGSHPMAGSEQTGLSAARADLYEEAVVIVTPGEANSAESVGAVESFWRSVGACVETMSPEVHDAVVARTSHLPHLVAAALVESVLGQSGAHGDLCASGFRDTTRVAAGAEALWHDIIKTNADEVSEALGELIVSLELLRGMMQEGEFEQIREYLGRSREMREKLG